MDSYRFLWIIMGSKGSKGFVDSYGFLEVLADSYGFLWILMDSQGYLWILMDAY